MTLLLWQIAALLGFGALLVALGAANKGGSTFWMYFTSLLLLADISLLAWKISELLW